MRAHLVAIQPDMQPEHYRSADAFHARIGALAREAVAGLDDAPTLLAFPEAIALPLAFTLGGMDRAAMSGAAAPATTLAAAWQTVRTRPGRLASLAFATRRVGPSLLFLLAAERVFDAWIHAFRDAARDARATIVAGTAFLPWVEREPARGLHVADSRVHNVSCVLGPQGTLLGRRAKRYLMPRERAAGVAPAPWHDVQPVHTPVGSLGVTVCLDAFYDGIVERLDGLGATILVQPSANHAAWTRPWPADPRVSEGEAWLRHGLRRQVQGRLHARIGLNPMLVGRVMDLAPQGRSSIVADAGAYPGHAVDGHEGVVALAPAPDREAFVRATLDVPGPPGSREGREPAQPPPTAERVGSDG